jgi:putative ABC transport system permease protein
LFAYISNNLLQTITFINIDYKNLFNSQFSIKIAILFISIIALLSIYAHNITYRIAHNKKLSYYNDKIITIYRNVIIFIQFTCTIFFIISAIVIFRQIDHLNKFDRGLNLESVYAISVDSGTEHRLDVLAERIAAQSGVLAVTRVGQKIPDNGQNQVQISVVGQSGSRDNDLTVSFMNVVPGFDRFFGIEMRAGRWFDQAMDVDRLGYRKLGRTGSAVISEGALRQLGFSSPEDALGTDLNLVMEGARALVKIIGIAPDIVWGEGRADPAPQLYVYEGNPEAGILYRLATKDATAFHSWLTAFWAEMEIGSYIAGDSLEVRYQALLADDRGRLHAVLGFAFISVALSLIGLYGLTANYLHKQGRELALRKLHGASTLLLTGLLSRRILTPLAGAAIVAVPIAFHFNATWLKTFSERIELGPTPFLFGVILAILAALGAVLPIMLSASRRSPILFLRSEN